MRWLLLIAITGCTLNFTTQTATAAEPIKYCSTGTITMGPFDAHIERIRQAKRYDDEDIDKLIADQKAAGPDFFSTQVVTKEEQSGSGDFDLNLFQGFSDPQTKYKSDMKWACTSDDYAVAYFVGFKVKEIGNGTILVTPEKGTVNVVSLKTLDPNLDKHTKVQDSQSHAVLCDDIAQGCIKTIFFGQY